MSIINSDFSPPWWLANGHLQTLLPRLLYRKRPFQGRWQTFTLSDGDMLDLCWHEHALASPTRPLLVIFHGLEGSVDSPYVWQLMQAAKNQQWDSVVMHFRGCGPRQLNRLARAYHSGDSGDARELLDYLRQQNPQRPLVACGFSLGGNMLAKLLSEKPAVPLSGAVVCAAPLDLYAAAERIDQGFSKIYRRYLLTPLKQKFQRKQALGIITAEHPLAKVEVSSMRSFWQFDDKITAPLHGFASIDDYYTQASAKPRLKQVQIPLHIIHAKDDPFMTAAVIPTANELAPATTYELSQRGGHMGFIDFQRGHFKSWLPDRICRVLNEFLTP